MANKKARILQAFVLDGLQYKPDQVIEADAAAIKVLKEAGRVILSNLRKIDFPCRYGGDEIIILLPQASGAEAVRLAQRLSQELSELRIPVPFSKTRELRVTMSIDRKSVV